MKRSFYEMLGVAHDADQAQIDIAYAQTVAKFNAVNLRGVTAAVTEARLVHDGYKILSSPEQRARYDAKLLEGEPGGKVQFFPDDSYGRRRLGIGTVVLIALSTVLGTIVYRNLSTKMDEVRTEHVQAIARHKEEQTKTVVIDTTHTQATIANTSVVSGGQQKR